MSGESQAGNNFCDHLHRKRAILAPEDDGDRVTTVGRVGGGSVADGEATGLRHHRSDDGLVLVLAYQWRPSAAPMALRPRLTT